EPPRPPRAAPTPPPSGVRAGAGGAGPAPRLRELDGRPRGPRAPTDRLPLPGGETADLEGLVKAAMERGASERTARHLVAAYGSESAAVLNLVDRDRALGRPSSPGGRPCGPRWRTRWSG